MISSTYYTLMVVSLFFTNEERGLKFFIIQCYFARLRLQISEGSSNKASYNQGSLISNIRIEQTTKNAWPIYIIHILFLLVTKPKQERLSEKQSMQGLVILQSTRIIQMLVRK